MRPEEYEKMARLEDRHWWFLAKRKMARALLDGLPAARVLDLGCGTGGLTRSLGDPFATDLYLPALRLAHRRGLTRLSAAHAHALPFPGQAFDLVTAFDVLYHQWVEDDRAVLGEVHRVLRPGGHLLITDSALPLLRSRHDQAVMAARRYRLGELRARVEAAGFRVQRASYAHFLLFPAVAAVRLAGRLRPGARGASDVGEVPAWLNRALLALYDVEVALLRVFDLPWGSSVVCLARR